MFSSVISRLIAYRADTGEQLLDLDTHLSQMGPPMTFMLDGKQFIVVAGGPQAQGGGGGGRGGAGGGAGTGGGQAGGARGAAPAGPPRPSHLLALVVDGTGQLP